LGVALGRARMEFAALLAAAYKQHGAATPVKNAREPNDFGQPDTFLVYAAR
jgi:hypothetical protein